MKKCFKCGIKKELSDFYVHPAMRDGHLNKCIECTKKDVAERELKLRADPAWCEKERLRSKEKYYRLNYRESQYLLNKKKLYKNATYKGLHKKLNLKKDEIAHHWNYNYLSDIIVLKNKFHRFVHRYLILNSDSLTFYTIENTHLDTKEKHLNYIESLKKLF